MDEMEEFNDYPMVAVLEQLNLQNLPESEIQNLLQEDFSNEEQHFSKMMQALELKMLEEKQQEIDQLGEQLQKEYDKKMETKRKLEKLMGSFSTVHKQFLDFTQHLLTLTKRSPRVANELRVGPFKEEHHVDEFLALLNVLSEQLTGKVDTLQQTTDLMEKVNRILGMAVVNPSETENPDSGEDQETIEQPSSSAKVSMDTTCELSNSTNQQEVIQSEGIELSSFSRAESASTDSAIAPFSHSRVKDKVHGIDKNSVKPRCLCGYVYASQQVLRAHITAIQCPKGFQCNICSARFSYKASLAAHLKQKHGSGGSKRPKMSRE